MLPALLLLVAPAFLPPAQLSETAFTRKVVALVAESHVPGAALQVWKDGKPIHSQAAGVASVETQAPYTTELAFEIGSLSKQFTATALMMLVHEGKLALDAPIGSLLDDLPEAWRAATVEQVMHHMSGIPDYEAIAGYDFYNQPRTVTEVIAVAAGAKPAFAPGARFDYSNTGYFILSLIVEKKSGVPFDEFLEKRLFAPVGMRSTYALHRPAGVTPATGYRSRSETRTAEPPIAWSSTLGAGGIVSTLADMQRWDEMLYGEKLLPRALLVKLWEPARATDGKTIPYGAGWFTDSYRDVSFISHSGGTNGFSCFYLRFPEHHVSVLVHTNTYGGEIGALAQAAAAHFLPELNYYSLEVPSDPDPETTQEHMTALRQAVLGEGELDLLADGMKDFARGPKFAATRTPLVELVNGSHSFRFLRMRSVEGRTGEIEEFLYRQANASGETFWTMRFSEGYLASLDWADE